MTLKKTLISTALIGACLLGQSALAKGKTSEGDRLDIIVVTAERRLTSILETPIGVTVIDPNDAPAAGVVVDPIGELARRTPNFNFVNAGGAGQNFASVRGVGPFGEPFNALDTTLGLFVDGVPVSLIALESQLLDVERAEILKGPQGALFGRATLGGALNIVTRTGQPDDRQTLRFEAGENGYLLGEVAAGGVAANGQVRGRIAARYSEFNGDIAAPVIDDEIGGFGLWAVRGSLGADITNRFSVDFSGFYNEDVRNSPLFVLRDGPGFPISGSDLKPENNREALSLTLKANFKSDKFKIVSLTNYQDNEVFLESDLTDSIVSSANSGAPGFVFDDPDSDFSTSNQSEEVFFQEVRITSIDNAEIAWSLGANYYNVDFSSQISLDQTFPLPFPPGGVANVVSSTDAVIETETIAVFGDISWPVTERLRLSANLRIARDEQEFTGLSVTSSAAPFPITVSDFAETAESFWTGRIGAVYKLTETSSLYANVARGYSSEGFQRAFIPTGIFASGHSIAAETGYRAFFFDQRVSVDATGFINDISNAPFTELVDPIDFIFEIRTQDYVTYGLELQAEAFVFDDLEVFGVVGLQEGERNASNSNDPAVLGAGRVPGVPTITAAVGLRYTPTLAAIGSPGNALVSIDGQYVGDRAGNLRNTVTLDSYWIANARLGWRIENAEVYFFARNFADERFEASGFSFPPNVEGVVPATGRILGGGFSLSF